MTTTEQHSATALPPGVEILPHPPIPAARARLRIKRALGLRRLLPTDAVVARAERRAAHRWRTDPQERAQALRAMGAIVAGTPREGELEPLAQQMVVELAAWRALFWQPWRAPAVDRYSRGRLLEAQAAGRGVLLSPCHIGPYFATSLGLAAIGIVPGVVFGDWWFQPPSADDWGLRLARWRRGLPSQIPAIRARGTYHSIAELLARGRFVQVYFDVPGRRESRFLGKRVLIADGTARLAVDTGAAIVPLRARREGARMAVQALAPLYPERLGGVDEVHDALASVHERLILEDPAAKEDPAEAGWGAGASAEGWLPAPRAPQGGVG